MTVDTNPENAAKNTYTIAEKTQKIFDSTTTSGSSNAAQIDLGPYRTEVDVLVNGSASDWTVTVEIKDSEGTWIFFNDFSANRENDTLQLETTAKELRVYFDKSVNNLTVYGV